MSRSFFRPAQITNTKQLGTLGEKLVAQWLYLQGWRILQHQYRTRWGEIDLIATQEETDNASPNPTLLIVEVKTRSRRNWDHDGLLAITPAKQNKLIQSAQLFLAEYPELTNYFCRFDVALVRSDPPEHTIAQPSLQHRTISQTTEFPDQVILGQPVNFPSCRLILQQYIESAFWVT